MIRHHCLASRLFFTVIAAFLPVLMVVHDDALAIVTSDGPGTHIVAPGEEVFGLNLDGVGFLSWRFFGTDLPLCSSVLIGDRDVLTAAHCIVEEDGTKLFFDDEFGIEPRAVFDTPEGRLSLAVSEAGTHYFADYAETLHDLAVVRLAEDAPASIPRYPIYTAADQVGQATVVMGYGSPGDGATGEDLDYFPFNPEDIVRRAGLNRFEAPGESLIPPPGAESLPESILLISDFDSGLEEDNLLAGHGVASDLGFGPDEVGVAFGDSGGPAFIGNSVAGIASVGLALDHTALPTELPTGMWGDGMAHMRLSEFQDFLTTATEGRAVFVPEPGTQMLLIVSGSLLFGVATRRRRTVGQSRIRRQRRMTT